MKTQVYTSDKRTHFFKELREIIKDISTSNFLAYQMAKRDLQAQYRQSYLGFFWAFAPIIANSLVWIFLNNSGAVNVNSSNELPYIAYVIIGTTLWSIFTEAVLIPITSVNSSKNLLSKINFPKEALLISGLYKTLFNFILKIVLIIGTLVIYNISPGTTLMALPLYLITIFLFAFSIGLLLAPIGLIYTDINKIITTVLPFVMYITPVVYTVPKAGVFRVLFYLNPLTYVFNDSRNSLANLPLEHISFTILLCVISLMITIIALVIFRKSMPIIIEKISN